MGLRPEECLVAVCDGCYEDDFGLDHTPHFPDVDAAKQFLDACGWTVRFDPETGHVKAVYCDECWAALDEVEKASA